MINSLNQHVQIHLQILELGNLKEGKESLPEVHLQISSSSAQLIVIKVEIVLKRARRMIKCMA